jgi:hypothetical protein
VTLHHPDRASEALGLPPGHHCRYAVALGYADPEAERRGRIELRGFVVPGRRPLSELVHHDRFGG